MKSENEATKETIKDVAPELKKATDKIMEEAKKVNKEEVPKAIEPERVKRILESERLSIDRGILEGFVQFVYEHLLEMNEPLKDFSLMVHEANNSSKKKRKVSVNIKDFSSFVNDSIKFMFRMQGAIQAVQGDIDADGYPVKKKEQTKEMEVTNEGMGNKDESN